MNLTSRLICIALAAMLVSLLLAMGPATYLLHVPSLAWMLGLFAAGMLVSYHPMQTLCAFDAALTQSRKYTPRDYARHVAVLDGAHQLAWAAGFIVFMLGLLQAVGTLGSPDQIGSALAVCVTPLFYAAILAELLINPFRNAVIAASAKAGGQRDGLPTPRGRTTMALVLTALCLVVAMFVFCCWSW